MRRGTWLLLPLLVGCSADFDFLHPPSSDYTLNAPVVVQPFGVQHGVFHGEVTRLLPDDNKGSRHQHFVFRTESGRQFKVAHNIDLAPYVPLQVGDQVEIKGDVIKSRPMDVLHWTHYDPAGQHPDGYIRHQGRSYARL